MQESGRLTDKQSPEGLVPGPPPGLPFFPGLGAGGFFQRGAPPTDFARAMDIYHQVPNLTKYYNDSSQNVAHFTKKNL